MVHQSINTSADDASKISNVLSVKRSCQIQVCQHYLFQHANYTNQQLIDHGANGGLAGSDMRVIPKPQHKINIQGIDNHEVTGLDVVTAATLLNTSQGKVIGIFNEYAYLGKGSSIHSSGQLEWFKTNVDEKSVKVGGTQLITTLDGYSVPLLIKDGLAYATSLGKSLTNPLVTPCLMLMVISMSASLPTSTPSWMHLQEIVGHTQKSLLFSQPISIRVHPKSLTGMLYTLFCMDIPIQHQGHFQCHHQAWNCSTHPGLHQKAL